MAVDTLTTDRPPLMWRDAIGQGRKLWRSTRVCNQRLTLSSDVYERLGRPRFVGVVIGRQHLAIALRPAASRAPGADIFKAQRLSGGSATVFIGGALKALRRSTEAETTELPHRWADGALIVDVSSLPLAGGS